MSGGDTSGCQVDSTENVAVGWVANTGIGVQSAPIASHRQKKAKFRNAITMNLGISRLGWPQGLRTTYSGNIAYALGDSHKAGADL